MSRTSAEPSKPRNDLAVDDLAGELPDELFISQSDAAAQPDLPDDDTEPEETAHPDAIGAYLREIGRYPLLKAEEEISLTQRIEQGDKASRRLASGRIRSERTRVELERVRRAGEEARERMI